MATGTRRLMSCHGGLVAHNIEYDMVSHWKMTGFRSFCSQYYAPYPPRHCSLVMDTSSWKKILYNLIYNGFFFIILSSSFLWLCKVNILESKILSALSFCITSNLLLFSGRFNSSYILYFYFSIPNLDLISSYNFFLL